MFKAPTEGREAGGASTSASNSSTPRAANGGKSDLLMRFFESDFFDAWIAVT